MGRIGRLLAGVAIGLSLLFTPLAPTAVAETAPAAVVAQQQEPERAPESPADRNQRTALGVTGLVLIGVVLLSRRLRKKPVLFMEWKKK